MPPIDLAKPRILAFRDRGHLLTFVFRPGTLADWKAYFEAIVNSSEYEGRQRTDTNDTRSAKLGIVEALLTSAAGYAPIDTAEGKRDITDLPGWQKKIPASHKLVLGDMLVATRRHNQDAANEEGFVLTLEGERFELESFWTYDEQLGAMVRSSPLVHYFQTPTPDQQRRFTRDSSRSVIQGGSRTQKTFWKGSQLTLIQLYDELITGVEGYVYDGNVMQLPANVAAMMDPYHKVVAAAQLFAAAEVESAAAGEQEA